MSNTDAAEIVPATAADLPALAELFVLRVDGRSAGMADALTPSAPPDSR